MIKMMGVGISHYNFYLVISSNSMVALLFNGTVPFAVLFVDLLIHHKVSQIVSDFEVVKTDNIA